MFGESMLGATSPMGTPRLLRILIELARFMAFVIGADDASSMKDPSSWFSNTRDADEDGLCDLRPIFRRVSPCSRAGSSGGACTIESN